MERNSNDVKAYIESTGSVHEIKQMQEAEDSVDGGSLPTEAVEAESLFTSEDIVGAEDEEQAEEKAGVKIKLLFAVAAVVLAVTAIVILIGFFKGDKEEDNSPPDDGTAVTTEAVTTAATLISDLDALEIEDRPILGRDLWSLYDGVIGYLQIKNTPVDYLVVQADDNEKYLTIDELGNERRSGSIFGDYRNDFENLDENNIIYGHNMADGSMFAGLLELRKAEFYQSEADTYIYFNSVGYNNIFKIFSVYETDLTSFNFIQTGFDEESKAVFMATVRERNEVSVLDPESVPDTAKLLTLSTCTQGGTHRLVVHAYLIGREIV